MFVMKGKVQSFRRYLTEKRLIKQKQARKVYNLHSEKRFARRQTLPDKNYLRISQ